MDCPFCHTSAAPAARYCSFCGTRLPYEVTDSADSANRRVQPVHCGPRGFDGEKTDDEQTVPLERLARTVVDALPGMVGYWTSELRCAFANRAYADWFGVRPKEIVGLHLRDLLGDELFLANGPFIQGALRGEPQVFERTLVKADGSTGYSWAQYIPDCRDGRVHGFFVSVSDITELKRAQMELRAHEAESRKLAEIARRTDNVVILTDPTGKIEWVNDGFQRVTGYALPEVRGRTPGSVLQGPDSDPQVAAEMRQAVRAGRPFTAEILNYNKSGGTFWVRIDGQPLYDETGRLTHFMAIESDITALRQSEAVLRLNESRLRLALDVAEMLSWDWEIGGNIVTFSRDYGEYYGLPSMGTVLPFDESALLPIHPGDRERMADAVFRSLETGQPFQLDYRGPSRQGEQTWYHTRGSIIEIAEGQPQRMIGITQDITLQKHAEHILIRSNVELERLVQQRTEDLQQSKTRLREQTFELQTILDSVPAMIVYQDLEHRMIRVNAAHARAYGLPKDQIEGKTDFELGSPYAEKYHADDLKVLTTAEPLHNVIEPFATPAGIRWLQTEKVPHRDLNGNVIGLIGLSIDITERKLAEEALSEERKLLMNLLSASFDHIYFKDHQCRFIRVNDILARELGIDDPVDLFGKSDFDLFEESCARRFHDVEQQVIATGRPVIGLEEQETWLDGTVTWASTTIVPMIDVNGTVNGIIGISRDISERKRAQEELREKESLLSQSQRIARIGSWCDDLVNHRVTWSDETYRLFGVSPEDFVPSLDGVMNLIHPDDRVAMQRQIEIFRTEDKPVPLEYRVPLPDGLTRILRDQGELVRDADHRPVRIIGTVQDVTESRRAEMALRAHQELLQSIVDSSESFMYLADLDGRFLLMNRALEEFCHVARGELIGQIRDVVFPSDIAIQHRQNDLEVLRCKHPLRFEETAVGAGSSDLRDYFTVKYPVRDAMGNIYAVGGISTDITERKRIDEKLREREYLLSQSQRIARIGSWSVDLTTRVGSWTAETYRLYGVSPENFIPSSASILGLVHPDDRGRMQEHMRAKIAGEDAGVIEFRVPLPDGSVRTFSSSGELVRDGDGKPARLIGAVQDITDRKQAEQKLLESRQRLEFALRGADLGSWDWNPRTGAVVYSDLWAQMLEYRPDEIASDMEFFKQHLHPEDLPDVLERLKRHVEGLLPEFQSEHRLRTKSGEWKWFLDRGRVMERDENGLALRATGVVSDITERKRAENALRENEQKLRLFHSLMDFSDDSIAVIDPATSRFLYVNQMACSRLGYTREELLQLGVIDTEATLPDDFSWAEHVRDVMAAKSILVEGTQRRQDGSLLPVEVNFSYVVFDRQGYLIAMARDITDRLKAEADRQQMDALLRSSEERYRSLFETCGDSILIVDAEGRIIDANPAAIRMNGYTKEELLNLDIRELVDSRSAELAPEIMSRILAGETVTFEVCHRRKDRTTYPLEIVCTRLPLANSIVTIGFGRDISERKRSEAQIRVLRDTLAHAGRLGTLSEISSGLAHELNQPLAAIHMDASTALLTSQRLDSDLRECLQRIGEQSFRAGEIIRRMRSFIRRDSSSTSREDLNGLIREVLMLLADSLRQSRVTVELNLAESLPPILVDGIQIQQVLVNLIRNAGDAVMQNVDLPRVVTIRTEVADDEIRTSIADNGSGLDPALATKLFFPFQTTKPQGLGLGLSICRTLIEAHRGRIEAHPNPERGTTFFFTLPISS